MCQKKKLDYEDILKDADEIKKEKKIQKAKRKWTKNVKKEVIRKLESSSAAVPEAKAEASGTDADEERSLLKTTDSGMTIEQFEQKEASRKLLSGNDLKKLIIKDFENFTKKKNNENRQNNILTSIGVLDSPQNRKLLLSIYNNK